MQSTNSEYVYHTWPHVTLHFIKCVLAKKRADENRESEIVCCLVIKGPLGV